MMRIQKHLFAASALLFLTSTFTAPTAKANNPNEYDAIVHHLKTKYKAKKVSIPFLWLAKFAVKVVRPAGVKSFSLTLFEDLKFSRESLDREMQEAMKNSFSPDWTSIFRVRVTYSIFMRRPAFQKSTTRSGTICVTKF